ncbi:hypothetical protein AX17_000670 [Amanita inopinata Kibby_2008]|nr:hypothetical protein AX17_000670 [Amanita inopinata Kibby_2008]
MTSRVRESEFSFLSLPAIHRFLLSSEKGGPVFRPVAQPRPRATSTSIAQPHDKPVAEHAPPQVPSPSLVSQSHELGAHFPRPPTLISTQQEPSRTALAPPTLTRHKTVERVPPSIQSTALPITQRTALSQPQIQSTRMETLSATSIQAESTLHGYIQPLAPDVGIPHIPIQHTVSDSGHLDTGNEKPKRRRKPLKAIPGGKEQDEADSVKNKQSRRAPSATCRRRSRGPSLPPYDPSVDPGEELDPTVVTMATLCDDIGQGRVSSKAAEILSNHAAWKSRNREKRVRMRTFMEMKKYGREHEAENGHDQGTADSKDSEAVDGRQGPATAPLASDHSTREESEGGFDYTQNLAASRFNAQVRIGPNGETIIDEESLVVDRTEAEDTQDYTHIVESDASKFVNSATYSKRFRGSRWSAEETERFYDALSQYGENYELIAYVLPGRDRKSCKNKFKVEDKRNQARINYCLNNRVPVDMQTLSRMTGKDFSGPVPDIRPPTQRPMMGTEEGGDGVVHEDSDSQLHRESTRTKPARKRSRSRNVDCEAEVVIVGNIDEMES